ncbi:hypothetical protein [Nocardia sp. NPDC004711]
MTVIIGMDPHKRSATIEIIDPAGHVLAAGRYGTDTVGYTEMLTTAQQFTDRVWAVEGCNGIGRQAVVQLRHPTDGRVYYDGRRAGGKTSKEAMRALKRRLSNTVYKRMLNDQLQRESAGPGGQSGTTIDSSATGLQPAPDPSDKPPGPTNQANPTPTSQS